MQLTPRIPGRAGTAESTSASLHGCDGSESSGSPLSPAPSMPREALPRGHPELRGHHFLQDHKLGHGANPVPFGICFESGFLEAEPETGIEVQKVQS